ncbi:glycosyltransferase family 2 protein [Luteimonas aestuarii]|uniref:glycosyltransferase family 2 protein n=1 Tax=Luteimonas aestuarii TaxID=453837 RepID=UPI001FB59026|nr:glycosyltransferase family 2 protein [Luteimonas aestuarii]
MTHRPDVTLLRRAVAAISRQVGGLVLVDNATRCDAFEALVAELTSDGGRVLRNPGNLGLAAGFNAGIGAAREAGFSHVLLLDQDSVAEPSMVEALLDGLASLSRQQKVAAVGAQFVDPRNGVVGPFVRIGFPFNRKLPGGPGERVRCDFLISSGSLVPLDVIDDVGAMDEALFIDNVDMDWSFRARHLGYQLYGVCDARMQHSIGDALRPSRFRRRGVFIHSPLRLYYLTRNRLLLYRRPHTPAKWVAQDLPRLAGKFMRMALLIPPRGENARAMLHGIRDGLVGRSGPRP